MKKLSLVMALFVMLSILVACNAKSTADEARTEILPQDYGNAIIFAQNEFTNTFSAYDEIEINETHTMVRTNDSNRLIVQFSYLSNNGDGIYGYEILRNEHGGYEIVQQGEEVTIDNLVRE